MGKAVQWISLIYHMSYHIVSLGQNICTAFPIAIPLRGFPFHGKFLEKAENVIVFSYGSLFPENFP